MLLTAAIAVPIQEGKGLGRLVLRKKVQEVRLREGVRRAEALQVPSSHQPNKSEATSPAPLPRPPHPTCTKYCRRRLRLTLCSR